MTLCIRQYVYLAVYSNRVSAADMAAAIGLEADGVPARGSRREGDDPISRSHTWRVVCNERGLGVDEQLELLVDRLRPYQEALRSLGRSLREGDGDLAGISLNVVRYLDDEDGEADEYQHRLLGWHLNETLMRFALDLGAEIDVDEYGQD